MATVRVRVIGLNIASHLYLRLGVTIATSNAKLLNKIQSLKPPLLQCWPLSE